MITQNNFGTIEKLFEQVEHIDSNNLQLGKGTYSSILTEISFENYLIRNVIINTSTQIEGTSDNEFYMFILVTSATKQMFRGQEFNQSVILVIGPSEKYSKISFGENTSLVIYIKKEDVYETFGKLETGIYPINDTNENKIIISLASQLFYSYSQNNELYPYYAKLIVRKMKYFLLINKNNKYKSNNYKASRFYDIKSYIDEECNNGLEIVNIADKFNITDRTLRNIFYMHIGISPKQYQKTLQLNYLKREIIKNPSLTISDILINSRLPSQSFISKEFKLHFNLTPSNFKKKILDY